MASNGGHTVKAFDADMRELRARVAEMGGRAEQAISDAMEALVRRDVGLAMRVVEDDKKVDVAELEVERQVARIIGLRGPQADDLREVLAALRIAGVVERIADYAKNVAKRVPLIADERSTEQQTILPAMAREAASMVRAALDAFAARDPQAAADVCAQDKAVDDFYNSLFRTLLTYMMENPHTITASTHLLFIAKNLERIGDHATNIAEMVYYAATGQQMADRPRGIDALTGERG